ncbi:response regulator [Pseudoalteromonas espejiana]
MFKRFHPHLSEGSGLGLALVKKHVEFLKGTINFVSSSHGSTFKITLPLRNINMNNINPPVLIIDDDAVDRYILKRLIKEAQLELTIFEKSDGQEALEFLMAYDENKRSTQVGFPYNYFLDINMPRVNGIQFLEAFSELRKTIELNSCVIMMFSTSEREEDRVKILAHEFVIGYLLKGALSAQELKEKVLAVLNG